MKLLSFFRRGHASWGVVVNGGVLDLGARFADIPDLRGFLERGQPNIGLGSGTEPDFALDEIEFAPVIANPDKIVMAAVNYFEEGEDRSSAPDYPVLFLRLPSSQIGHGQPLIRPASSQKLDYEGELAVVIGKAGRHISRADAMGHVAGYSIYNDGSVRDWQKHSHQFTPGKNFTGTGAFGPWMLTPDDLRPPAEGLSLTTHVNGVEKQRTDTSRMIFDIPYLISYISTFAPLVPGDVIVTGTCKGFGSTRKPPEFLQAGDRVDIEIEGIGRLSNIVEDEKATEK